MIRIGEHGDKYYVGKSDNVDARIAAHMAGLGARVEWLARHGHVHSVVDPVTAPIDDLNAWEQKETVRRMIMHGVDNVRGWEFTSSAPLSAVELEMVKRLHVGASDLCRRCGRSSHMASACYARTKAAWLFDIDRMIWRRSVCRRVQSYRRRPYARTGISTRRAVRRYRALESEDSTGDLGSDSAFEDE